MENAALEKAQHEYQRKMPLWQNLSATLERQVLNAVAGQPGVFTVQSRIKAWPAILEKMDRRGAGDLSSITDIVGVRIVVTEPEYVDHVIRQLAEVLNLEDLVLHKLRWPDDDQFISYHAIGRIRTDNTLPFEWRAFQDEPIEIQIRSSFAQALSEVEHRSSYRPAVEEASATRRLAATGIIQRLEDIVEKFQQLIEQPDVREKNDIHPFMVSNSFLLHPNPDQILSEVQIGLGTEYRMDFLIREADGEYIAVEIENPRHAVVTRGGNISASVNHAVQQVEDWQEWIGQNLPTVQRYYPGISAPRGLVIIGRSNTLGLADRQKLARRNINLAGRIKIITYDEVIAGARFYVTSLRHALSRR